MSNQELDKIDNTTLNGETNETEDELLKKAELLIDLRGYQKDSLKKDQDKIDIKVSKPTSDETVLIRLVTKSNLKSDGVGVEKVNEIKRTLDKPDVDKVILLGNRFTNGAKEGLIEDGIEYFSNRQRIVSTLNQKDLYNRIVDFIERLCKIKCGHIPESEAECKGYSEKLIACSVCGGSGKLPKSPRSYLEYNCSVCGGTGLKKNHYSCMVRLISDNADLHFARDWTTLLHNDFLSIIKLLRKIQAENGELGNLN